MSDNTTPGAAEERLPDLKLKDEAVELAQRLVAEQNPSQIKDLTQLFNLNLAKKNALRLLKYSDLLDHITEGMVQRFEKRPDEMSNKDLMDYMNTVITTIEKTQKTLQQADDVPQVVINQQTNNQINIESEQLSRDSRERVMDFIKTYLENVSPVDIDENKEDQ